MKKLYLNNGGLDSIFETLQSALQGTLTSANDEYALLIKSKTAKGKVLGSSYTDKLAYVEFDLTFNEDVMLSIESSINSPVLIVYCHQGDVGHSFGSTGALKMVRPDQCGIFRNTTSVNSVLYFKGFQRIKFSLISSNVSRAQNVDSDVVYHQFEKLFTDDITGNFRYTGPIDAKVGEKLRELKSVVQKGIVGSLLKKRILEEIMQTETMLHSYGYQKIFQPVLSVLNKQMNEFRRITSFSLASVFAEFGQAGRQYLTRI
jgi:hypothetical protein